MVSFLDQNSLIPLFDGDFGAVLSNPVVFEVNKTVHYGYEATLLQEITKQISKAYLKGKLSPAQEIVGKTAEILYDAFAATGIIALIDEVTGYQEVREKDALQKFLTRFLENEKGKWVKTFPDEFFEAIFRMKGWDWRMANKGKKPQVVGHYINDFVYSRLAPKILDELRTLNPKDEKGNRKGKHPQWISMDYGHPMLKEHLNLLVAFAQASGYNWTGFKRMVERARPKFEQDGSQQIYLDI